MSNFTTHVFNKNSDNVEEYLQAILDLEKRCFPPDWQYMDATVKYRVNLESNYDINLFLLNDSKQICGYALSVPMQEVYEELQRKDKDLEQLPNQYYLETIGIYPEFRDMGGSGVLIDRLLELMKERGISSCSVHARKINGFDQLIKRKLRNYTVSQRHIPRWFYGGGEPYEYICWYN